MAVLDQTTLISISKNEQILKSTAIIQKCLLLFVIISILGYGALTYFYLKNIIDIDQLKHQMKQLEGKKNEQPTSLSNWILLGPGNCMDDQNLHMPNFYSGEVNEVICHMMANNDKGAIAYDYQPYGNDIGSCRVRTLSDPHQKPTRWSYEYGRARNVTRTNKLTHTNCYVRTN